MYGYIKTLLTRILNHQDASVLTDVSARSRLGSRSIPDVQVRVLLASGIFLDRWIVVEAKDEAGVFRNPDTREAIFQEKKKYITSDTEWFVMVDPNVIVLRRIMNGAAYTADREILLNGLTLPAFLAACSDLTLEAANRGEAIEAFRAGNERWIASVNMADSVENRNRFYDDLHKSFGLLLEGCIEAIDGISEYLFATRQLVEKIQNDYNGSLKLSFDPFVVLEPLPHIDQRSVYRQDIRALRSLYYRSKQAFHTALRVLPRLGCINPASVDEMADALKDIAQDTASLLFSRALMLRFLEDHSFFGRKKYLCNGGLHAFMEMQNYFNTYYPSLIQQACEQGARYYHAVFADSDYDWVFESQSSFLSNRIEQVLYYLSFFNFASVREDVLSGIYQKIIDPSMRKRLGQVFTHPQVARYLVNKCAAIAPEGCVIDPACGTGTFLVEYFEAKYGSQIRRNIVTYDVIRSSFGDIRGNDISAVASSITQMQLLWRLLSFSEQMKRDGFPDISVASSDALICTNIFTFRNDWDEMDNNPEGYALVMGNPPWVRPERQHQVEPYGHDEDAFYGDISIESNLYNLFVYKAMRHWLKPGGILGFVVPLSLLDSSNGSKLRALFAPNSQWRIREIIDMEEIAEYVFPDVSINPIMIIAEKNHASEDDQITLRIAGPEVLLDPEGTNFDFDRCTSATMSYADVFTGDGRILSRLTPDRKRILDSIRAHPTWDSVAKKYWVGCRGARIIDAAIERPAESDLRWEQRSMLRRGAVFRRRISIVDVGYPVYKGEHLMSCQIVGQPVLEHVDIQNVSDPSLWRFPDILPDIGYAFQRISLNLTACLFNPREKAFLDTAVIFIPDERVSVPFDFLVLSSVYRWFYAVSQRVGVLAKSLRADIYSDTIERLPWSDRLLAYSDELRACREIYIEACRQTNQVLPEQFAAVEPLETLQKIANNNAAIEMRWSAISQPEGRGWHKYQFSSIFEYFYINDPEIFRMLDIILPVLGVDEANRDSILSIKLPTTPEGIARWDDIHAGGARIGAEGEKAAAISRLDEIVSEALNIPAADMEFIRQDLANDNLFRRLRPAEPYSARRLRGLWDGLDSHDRYR